MNIVHIEAPGTPVEADDPWVMVCGQLLTADGASLRPRGHDMVMHPDRKGLATCPGCLNPPDLVEVTQQDRVRELV